MHELSLCGAIADIVSRSAGERRVDVVHVSIGALRQVVPDSLIFCWSMVTCETPYDGSVLEIERVPAVLRCRSCAAERTLTDEVVFACANCGGLDMEVRSGEEFEVTALDLVEV